MFCKSILVPVDLAHPEAAGVMFDRARALLRPGGRLTVLHAVPDLAPHVTMEMPDDFLPEALRKADDTLRALVADAGLDADIRILTGQAPRAILDTADQVRADLIMIASHRPGLSDYLLGSTAARVVRHATCSVLVIR